MNSRLATIVDRKSEIPKKSKKKNIKQTGEAINDNGTCILINKFPNYPTRKTIWKHLKPRTP